MSQLNQNSIALEELKTMAASLPAAITIDATLTQEGAAADAKATGDALAGKAASTHNHAATEITSGTLPVTRGGTGNTSVDTTPTSGSTKMVTSGGVYTALSGKADSSHTQAASTISGGRFAGIIYAGVGQQTALDSLLRNSNLAPATADGEPGGEGEICWTYE